MLSIFEMLSALHILITLTDSHIRFFEWVRMYFKILKVLNLLKISRKAT
jgi:hypothetical protein